MGGLVKDDGSQVTLQAQTESGAVNLLVCDYKGGELRGYVDFDPAKLAELGANPSLFALFGKGLSRDHFRSCRRRTLSGNRPAGGRQPGRSVRALLLSVRTGAHAYSRAVRSDDDDRCTGRGPAGAAPARGGRGARTLHAKLDHPEWEHVAIIAGSLRHEELLDSKLSLEAIAWRLFHEEGEIRDRTRLSDLARLPLLGRTLSRCAFVAFPRQRVEMRDDDGIVFVDCAFCSKQFGIEV